MTARGTRNAVVLSLTVCGCVAWWFEDPHASTVASGCFLLAVVYGLLNLNVEWKR